MMRILFVIYNFYGKVFIAFATHTNCAVIEFQIKFFLVGKLMHRKMFNILCRNEFNKPNNHKDNYA